ncbi:MAG: transcription termination factor Rho [Verrucomicrobia bacterium]|nr:MAG: transcription termination factor Rho [Verrucomicrobiota bacterium]
MSNLNDQDSPSPIAAEALVEAPKTPRQRATKTTTARKTATKSVRKKAEPIAETVVNEPIMLATEAAPQIAKPKRVTRAKKVAAAEDAAPVISPPPAPDPQPIVAAAEPLPVRAAPEDHHRRVGRVPGGGPTGQREPNHGAGPNSHQSATHQGQGESRSKRRREKRKRKKFERFQNQGNANGGTGRSQNEHQDRDESRPSSLDGPKIDVDGMLEMAAKGFGFLRSAKKNFDQASDDVFVSPDLIRKHHLRVGQWIHGNYQLGHRGPQLVEIVQINGMSPADAAKLPHFDELKAINPTKRLSFETTPEKYTTRVLDIMAPVGRGQRGLIVSPPRSGKTTLLLHMAEAVREKYDEALHLMVVLIDERPEEVTEFRRSLPGVEIYASSNDEQARNHCRIAELAIERAKRLVEAGKDVFLLMDSITRLARAYNGNMKQHGRGTGSGGITIGALEVPRRLFAAARNTRGGGSLTILATALIQTNSRADEAIFMEFKGTGNMELVLDRKIAENYVYPAVDIFKSGTRREELLLAEHMLHKVHLIRRGLSGHRPVEAMERLLHFLKKFPNNPQMLLEIKG